MPGLAVPVLACDIGFLITGVDLVTKDPVKKKKSYNRKVLDARYRLSVLAAHLWLHALSIDTPKKKKNISSLRSHGITS
jgi:hypothetical protein